MRKRPLLAGAMVVSLCCLAGDALAKSKKPKDVPEETAPAADSRPSDAANIQVAASTAPTAATANAAGTGSARVGVGVSVAAAPGDSAAQRDLAASCAKMISAAPDAATQRSLMQTCSQQLGGARADANTAAAIEPPTSMSPPPPPPPAEPAPAPTGRAFGKAGNFMLNFRLGYVPSFSLGAPSGSSAGASFEYPPQGLLGAEFGFAIQSQRKLYLVVPLSFEFQGQTAMIMLPFGFQYDIALPIPNLYVTPRISMGYVALVTTLPISSSGGTTTVVGHAGLIAPEIGLKYVLRERMNLGIDLISVPIVFSPALALVSYRVAVYLGANF